MYCCRTYNFYHGVSIPSAPKAKRKKASAESISPEEAKRLEEERLAKIDALEQEMPGIRDDIEEYYTSTPLTWRDYTGVPEGAMYGTAKDVNLIGAGCILPRTNIPNLLLAGQCVTLHGMLGVLAGSLMTCSELLTNDVLFSQLRNGI